MTASRPVGLGGFENRAAWQVRTDFAGSDGLRALRGAWPHGSLAGWLAYGFAGGLATTIATPLSRQPGMTMQRTWIVLGSLAGCGAVAMAAFAAHGVSDPFSARVIASGVQMQGWHALALLGVGLWAPRGGRLADAAGLAFAVGLLLFCGAVYRLGVTGVSMGVVAPTGGTLLIIGWLLLATSAWQAR